MARLPGAMTIMTIALTAWLLSGCQSFNTSVHAALKAPVALNQGVLFGLYRVPVTTDFRGTIVGQRRGQVDVTYVDLSRLLGTGPAVLNITYSFDDLAGAARSGSIQNIHQVEMEHLHVLGVYHRISLVVHGD